MSQKYDFLTSGDPACI